MDHAITVPPYDSPHLPIPDGAFDFHIGTRDRLAFGQSAVVHLPRQNKLLAALPDADYARLLSHLELVQLPFGSMLQDAGDTSSFAYFPISGIVSPLCAMENGASAAVAMTGNEGMVGTSLLMGGSSTLNQAVVHCAGLAYRLGANRLKHEFGRGGHLCRLLLCHTQSLIAQMAQTAVCNRYHSIEQQVCRWLLQCLDRMPTNELSMTQELLANILGVRREGVTEAAGKLQKRGVIRYWRGRITVLSNLMLEERACECYAAVKEEQSRLTRNMHRHARIRR